VVDDELLAAVEASGTPKRTMDAAEDGAGTVGAVVDGAAVIVTVVVGAVLDSW
jgi:hypothetical protein